MVKDIFGNEHQQYQIIHDHYDRIVIIEDLKTLQHCVVHKDDLNISTKTSNRDEHRAPYNRFDLKETQQLHYTYDELLNKSADQIFQHHH